MLVLFICLLFWLLWVFAAAHGLSRVVASGGPLSVMPRLLIAVASFVVEHGLWGVQISVVAVCDLSSCRQGFSCPAARRVFLDQESNLCPLHCKEDSSSPDQQGSPGLVFLLVSRFILVLLLGTFSVTFVLVLGNSG